MPEALSSFLISVSCIIATAMLVPCIESIAKLLRRNAPRPATILQAESAKVYSREIA